MQASDEYSAATVAAEFALRGVCVLSGLVKGAHLELLREECLRLRGDTAASELTANDCVLEIPPNSRLDEQDPARTDPSAYMAARASEAARRELEVVLFKSLSAAAAAALGRSTPAPYLFNEHYVLKPALVASSFCWHTDAAHQLEAILALAPPGSAEAFDEYVSIWIPLDDVDETNGALTLLPRAVASYTLVKSIGTGSYSAVGLFRDAQGEAIKVAIRV